MKKILLIGSFLYAGSAWGCSFAPDADIFKTAEENYPNYQYVISGVLTGYTEETEQYLGRTYTFDVYSVHKGQVKEDTLAIQSPGHSCGYFGSPGRPMLWLTNDITSISEESPKYYFEKQAEAVEAGERVSRSDQTPSNTPGAISEKCKVWYDGCNTCIRNHQGGVAGCTKKACVQKEASYCLEHFTEDKAQTVGDGVHQWGVDANTLVQSPLVIHGEFPGGDLWGAFEGQVGTVSLYDSQGVLLGETYLSVVGDWMHQGPYPFAASLQFESPTTKTGTLVYRNDNASGLEERNVKHEVVVVFDPQALPYVVGPTSDPLDNFVGPTLPPPAQLVEIEPIDQEEAVPWWRFMWKWITSLFSW